MTRIGVLGRLPAELPARLLERASEFLLAGQAAERVVYLGEDDALEETVFAWASRIVGGDPTDEAAWARAASVIVSGSPAEIDAFVATERKRLSLRALVSLAPDAASAMEAVGEDTVIFVGRRDEIGPDDVQAASVCVYGTGPLPRVERIGDCWVVTPGEVGDEGGVGVLGVDPARGDLVFSAFDAELRLRRTTALPRAPGTA